MDKAQIDLMLTQTLEDARLSRGEKSALRSVLTEWKPQREQIAFVRSRAFELARRELSSRADGKVLRWLEEIVGLLAAIAGELSGSAVATPAVYFSDEHDCVGKIVSLINEASESVDVCMCTITDDRISMQLLAAHARGTVVRIVTDDAKVSSHGSDVETFRSAGIEVRTDNSPNYMHHKFAILDGTTVVTGSYNWTVGAAKLNQDNFIVADDPHLARAYSKCFERLWRDFA